jgi:hypothetical protein
MRLSNSFKCSLSLSKRSSAYKPNWPLLKQPESPTPTPSKVLFQPLAAVTPSSFPKIREIKSIQMPIIQIGSEQYDSDLLSNQSKSLLMELTELDLYIVQIKEDLLVAKQKRKKLSKETYEAIQIAKVV